jgi:hypothetical protein
MELGKHVLDKGLLDAAGRRAGKVDDLLLGIPDTTDRAGVPEPVVEAIISGPLALAQNLPRWIFWLAYHLYRVLGVDEPAPVEVPWSEVTAIDVVVHLSVPHEQGGWHALAEGVRRRFIGRLPGAW